MSHWAIDFGTTNTGVARWNTRERRPQLISLPRIRRAPDATEPLQAPSLIPSATHILEPSGLLSRIGRWGPLSRRRFIGRWADIGRAALELNEGLHAPALATSFKRELGRGALRTCARVGHTHYTARDVARIFLRELLAEIQSETGERPRELVITTPVDAFEAYRAELKQIARELGIRSLRFIDEPVAAAIGYGLGLKRERLALIVDFGGGTLDIAALRLTARGTERGMCEVLAKEGRLLGGDDVDRWLVEHLAARLELPLKPDAPPGSSPDIWFRLMLSEARRVKEAVYFAPTARVALHPPEELRRFEARLRGEAAELELSREELIRLLNERGLYDTLEAALESVLQQLEATGRDPEAIEDVLMIGGSTLLPEVYSLFEARFGRDKVRAWQPFEAVAFGACAYAADCFAQSDFIVHDYALVTHDPKTHDARYNVVVPSGTRFPTSPELWKRKLTPTCPLGEPESLFKLVIGEMAQARPGEQHMSWDSEGQLHAVVEGKPQLVVELNASNPTLGVLRPPHPPGDRKPRLEVALGVNAERWLCATVFDLRSRRYLMRGEPVVRLL